jgi:hypothetical protein
MDRVTWWISTIRANYEALEQPQRIVNKVCNLSIELENGQQKAIGKSGREWCKKK